MSRATNFLLAGSTRATTEGAPRFFPRFPLIIRELKRLLSKTFLEGGKRNLLPERKYHSLGAQRESCKQNGLLFIYFFPDDFGLRSPVIQKPFQPKRGIPCDTSVVPRLVPHFV